MTAGTINVEGRLRVRVLKSGASTTMADILRLVESAQSRSAPVQRLADTVAGRFAVGVMGFSLATLAFWSLAGPKLFPQVSFHLHHGQPSGCRPCALQRDLPTAPVKVKSKFLLETTG